MKRMRVISVGIIALLIILLSGCNLLGGSGKKVDPSDELWGDDYIEYMADGRDAVIAQFINSPVDTTDDMLLDIELSYEWYDGDMYYVYIDNYNEYDFFNGVVTWKSDNQTIDINVSMLAPNWYEYCIVTLEDDPSEYLYYIDGTFYEASDDIYTGFDYDEYYDDYDYYLSHIAVDQSSISGADIAELADHLYRLDTLWNYDGPITYYVYTYDDYNNSNMYTYELFVDPIDSQKVVIYDSNGNEVDTRSY